MSPRPQDAALTLVEALEALGFSTEMRAKILAMAEKVVEEAKDE